MTYSVHHSLVQQEGSTSIQVTNDWATARFHRSGAMSVRYPGKLKRVAAASYVAAWRLEDADGGHGTWTSEKRHLAVEVEIRTPDGLLFTADHVSLADLARFRDERGVSHGTWTYTATGKSEPFALNDGNARLTADEAQIVIAIDEVVDTKSAPALVDEELSIIQSGHFEFDLYRVGTFRATARLRELSLLDPDGNVVAQGSSRISYPVTLATLDKSRNGEGAPRVWTLKVMPAPEAGVGATRVRASVAEVARIRSSTILERLHWLIGERGSKLAIYGETNEQHMFVRLKILDEISAATIDMHELLDNVLTSVPQDPGVDVENIDVQAGVPYTLNRTSREIAGLHCSVNDMRVTAIDIAIGPSEHTGEGIPAWKVAVHTQGSITASWHGINLATCTIRNNVIHCEVGLALRPDRSFAVPVWIDERPLDMDTDVAGLLAVGLGVAAAEAVESALNWGIRNALETVFSGVGAKVPRFLAVILGDVFTYRSLTVDGDEILLEYMAPVEPEPRRHAKYLGIIGRSATQLGPNAWHLQPPTLGDTWAATQLSKVDHIVVVMMENRSFDHVLGYRARLPEDSDGLTDDLTKFLRDQGHELRALQDSGIVAAGGVLTKFPADVRHGLDDVAEQLSETLQTPWGRTINSPSGFRSNFADRARPELGLVDYDVLGYYGADDLPFYKFLAENYGWCERYFCSHPGPTLPNRMISLTGDVQYERTGEAILANNSGQNVFLSRATTIFDVLSRKGIPWRVYESYPSMTQLRMFARYASDATQIVDVARLEKDIALGDLPSVTMIEPAMHHQPASDDHPVADMYQGQLFLKKVYDALRSNEAIWRKTLLIITYDEHGGFYDHVVPPVAEARTRPMVASDGSAGHANITPDTVLTRYGVRVPTFVVSPWVPAGKGPNVVLDHCSILKTILARFCGAARPFLSDRVQASQSFEAYLTETQPRLNVPAPLVPPIGEGEPVLTKAPLVTRPVFRKQLRGGNVDYHDLTGMIARLLGRA